MKQLSPDEAANVAMIFVSVDPKRDTPARLKEYAEFFHPAIIGVTGTPEVIADIAKRYGVFYAEQKVETAGAGYVVDHSSDTFIVGRDGQLAGKMVHATPPDQVVVALRKHLQ
jgi:protein SCO1/2